MEAIAKRAMETLQTLQLTRGKMYGAEGYISNFEQAIQDLKETNHQYDKIMKKITFLSGIKDPLYKNLIAILKLDNNRAYNQCVMEVRRNAIDLEGQIATSRGMGRNRGGGNNREYGGIQRVANSLNNEVRNQIVPNGCIAPDVWRRNNNRRCGESHAPVR
jgi:hypothetical protein